MDFHSLTRKELQTLCKKNKIPANLTNVAMADALNSLEMVEGMEEVLNQAKTSESSIDTPQRAVRTTPGIARTGCRTSTRSKTVKKEQENSQPLTRTQRGTRRTMVAEVEEEAQIDAPEVLAGTPKRAPVPSSCRKLEAHLKESEEEMKTEDQLAQEKKDAPETPAVSSGRRRGTAASARRRNVETSLKEESSARPVHSVRRSVRLSEKMKMAESIPNEKTTQPIMVDSFSEEMLNDLEVNSNEGPDEVSQITGLSGVEFQKVPEDTSENANESEVYSVQKLDALSENERVYDDMNVVEKVVSEDSDGKCLITGKDKNQGDGALESKSDHLGTNSEVGNEKCDESDILSCEESKGYNDELPSGTENSNVPLDSVTEEELNVDRGEGFEHSAAVVLPSGTENSNVPLDSVIEEELNVDRVEGFEHSAAVVLPSGTENSNVPLDSVIGEELNFDRVEGFEDSAASVLSDNVSGDVMDLAANVNHVRSESPAKTNLDVLNLSTSAADHNQDHDIKLGLACDKVLTGMSFSEDEETDSELYGSSIDGNVSVDVAESHSIPFESMTGSKQLESDKEEHSTSHPLNCEESNSRNPCSLKIATPNLSSEILSGDLGVDFPDDFSDEETMISDNNKGPSHAKESMSDVRAGTNAMDPLHVEARANVNEVVAEEPAKTDASSPLSSDGTPTFLKQINISPSLISGESFTDQFSSHKGIISVDFIVDPNLKEDQTPSTEKSPGQLVHAIESAHEHHMTAHELLRDSLEKKSPSCSMFPNADLLQVSPSLYHVGSGANHDPCLRSPTPMKKSSTKTLATGRNMAIADNNKENIDNSNRKLECTREKKIGNKNKNTVEDDQLTMPLNEASLRQLTKMLKEKLQITTKTNICEDKNIAKTTKARPALQALSDNQAAIDEPKKEN